MVASAAYMEEQPVEIRKTTPTSSAEKRHDDGGMEDLEDFPPGQMANIRHGLDTEEVEPVEHHSRGRLADVHARGHIAGGDDDADDAETLPSRLTDPALHSPFAASLPRTAT